MKKCPLKKLVDVNLVMKYLYFVYVNKHNYYKLSHITVKSVKAMVSQDQDQLGSS